MQHMSRLTLIIDFYLIETFFYPPVFFFHVSLAIYCPSKASCGNMEILNENIGLYQMRVC